MLWDPAVMLPPGHDSGMITALAATDKFLVAGAIAHVTDSNPPAYTGIVYLVDLDFTDATGDYLPLPAGFEEASIAGGISIVLHGTTALHRLRISVDGSAGKPVVWNNDVPLAYLRARLRRGALGRPHRPLDGRARAVHERLRPADHGERPAQPAIWAATVM